MNDDPRLDPELTEEPETTGEEERTDDVVPETDTEPLLVTEPEPDPHGEANAQELRRMAWRKRRKQILKWSIVPILLLLALAGGHVTGHLILKTGRNHTLMDRLKSFKPKLITKVYDINGQMIGTFSREKRELITYKEIPQSFINGLVATEDSQFFNHIGVDPLGVMRAAINNVLAGEVVSGASTLTMQLVRLITEQRQTSMKRKITEAVLAIQIERMFTKEEIFERYANLAYLGHGLYGIQAASQYYFGKDAAELTLPESALLAGLIQSPYRHSPRRDLDAARKRRNHVLKRMKVEGHITEEEYAATIEEPVVITESDDAPKRRVGAYFLEEVRKYLFDRYGMDQVLDGGLNVYTTLDLKLQAVAEEALRKGLKDLDKRQGLRLEDKRFIDKETINDYWSPTWNTAIQEGTVVDGLVVDVKPRKATIRIAKTDISIGKYEVVWTKAVHLSDILSVGDVLSFKIHKWDVEKNKYNISLDQEPKVEGSLLAVNHHSGEIMAMVGGYDFGRSEYNRSWHPDALRQSGSVFKPLLYAAAVDSGFTLADTFFDEPTMFLDQGLFYVDENREARQFELTPEFKKKIEEGELDEPEPYLPNNYHRSYDGLITLRTALEKSKNIVSVKLFNRVGQRKIRRFARRLGIETHIPPFLSSALGATSVSLREIVKAYGTMANNGTRTEPFFVRQVTDNYGKTLEENKPLTVHAISPATAYLAVSGMKGVIKRGTGIRASGLDWNLCGKTGTTDNYTDAWFVGSDPDLTLGVWVGFDIQQTLGEDETGARAALPIWIDFMKAYIKDRPKRDWDVPENIIRVSVDRRTGLIANPPAGCDQRDMILETFRKGTEPLERCTREIHEILGLPYYMQHGKRVVVDPETGEPRPNIEFIIPHPRQR